ncbi:AAA family ATPase [Methanococcus maripaludis]|uniref:Putative ATPase n=1 Tax=Methanococcus maripaludis TaxID=39152 RepID=A0A7J9PDQ1_METMI|nr:AAA family ATPase [Methanococcus maripaludis]MBA2860856.1 putative ATPase [Methanococcus maripaludis]
MMIKKIKVSNFKSFGEEEITFDNFNVIVGPNSAGKSNFVEIFKFLTDVSKYGLENAVSMQGGFELLKNVILPKEQEIGFEIYYQNGAGKLIPDNRILEITEIIYKFKIRKNNGTNKIEVVDDEVTQRGKLYSVDKSLMSKIINKESGFKLDEKDKKFLTDINAKLTNKDGMISTDYKDNEYLQSGDIYPIVRMFELFSSKDEYKLILEMPQMFYLPPTIYFDGIAIYDFDPKLPKKAVPITGKTELEKDGSNLAIVIKQLFKNERNERKFYNLIKKLLPAINRIDVDKSADKRMFFNVCEEHHSERMPSCFISDGTINIIAMIIALFFEDNMLVIIEEPERNLHPKLMSKLVGLLRDASRNKQIILTTHNPELVKYAGLDSLIFISRNKLGCSQLKKVSKDDKFIKSFLGNHVGLDKIYIENLLENRD